MAAPGRRDQMIAPRDIIRQIYGHRSGCPDYLALQLRDPTNNLD